MRVLLQAPAAWLSLVLFPIGDISIVEPLADVAGSLTGSARLSMKTPAHICLPPIIVTMRVL